MRAAQARTDERRVGRFELRRVLGRGAQATVWLGYDARLDREVAVKLLNPDADTLEVSQWLHEARAVSPLTHPNIVPVFEADEVDGTPYLVFEFVDGPTLSESRRGNGALPARQAVTLMLGVLDALAAAHERGIVHRDLKPSNILLGKDGRARVMDFGIAARVEHGGDGRIVGTPGYMSPEAARGEAPVPAMDVFSAGMVLGELLAGRPLLVERDPYRAVDRVQKEDFSLPATVRVDDTLRAIVARAVARKAEQRYDSARSFHAALTAWLNPEVVALPNAAEGKGTLEFLLRRMRHKRDFPALSQSIVKIQKMASSETETLSSLAAEILKDVALTNKLLRMVNTVHFSQSGAGQIMTVSRAVQLIGFAGIRNMALSVVLLEHMTDKQQAAMMREEFLRALMAGTLAVELTPIGRESEETFIGAMFQNLGRLLTEYYFPEEAQQIRQLIRMGATDAMAQEAAAQRVLGLSFQELGQGVARTWGLPDELMLLMKLPPGAPPTRPIDRGAEYQRWLGRTANEITDAMLAGEGDALPVRLERLADSYGPALGLTAKEFLQATAGARPKLAQLAQALGIHIGLQAPSRRLIEEPPPPAAPTAIIEDTVLADAPPPAVTMLDIPMTMDKTLVAPPPAPPSRPAGEVLAAGIQEITNGMATEALRLNDVLRIVLQTMFDALQFQRVIFCLRDPRGDALTGRLGVGQDAQALSKLFHVPLRPAPGEAPDLFGVVCAKGLDMQIDDASVPNVAQRLPSWFRDKLAAPSFLLLPMMQKGASFGLIYADRAHRGTVPMGEQEMSMLRTLRNQAVMAFRQAERV